MWTNLFYIQSDSTIWTNYANGSLFLCASGQFSYIILLSDDVYNYKYIFQCLKSTISFLISSIVLTFKPFRIIQCCKLLHQRKKSDSVIFVFHCHVSRKYIFGNVIFFLNEYICTWYVWIGNELKTLIRSSKKT